MKYANHRTAIDELSASEGVFTTAQVARLEIPRNSLALAGVLGEGGTCRSRCLSALLDDKPAHGRALGDLEAHESLQAHIRAHGTVRRHRRGRDHGSGTHLNRGLRPASLQDFLAQTHQLASHGSTVRCQENRAPGRHLGVRAAHHAHGEDPGRPVPGPRGPLARKERVCGRDDEGHGNGKAGGAGLKLRGRAWKAQGARRHQAAHCRARSVTERTPVRLEFSSFLGARQRHPNLTAINPMPRR